MKDRFLQITSKWGVLVLTIVPLATPVTHAKKDSSFFSILDYGAKSNDANLNTTAIQAAIDACHLSGGGTVYFPSGRYLSGTIVLKSHVSLYLDAGAVLLGSTRLDDYPVVVPEFRSYTDNYTEHSLVYAEKAENISILGRGTIDGQGATFKDRKTPQNPYKFRPFLIRFVQCRDVTVRDVTLADSPMWVQHYLACDDVVIDGITVDSTVAGNNDGIDIDSCHRVRISNCDVQSGDDAIVLKASSARASREVVVTNCVLRSNCNGFKLGTESNGGFQNISFSNSTIYDTGLAAIALEMVDGGVLEQVAVSNIAIRNAGTAIFLRLGNRGRPFQTKGPGGSQGTWQKVPGLDRPGIGSFRRVMLSNIQAHGIDSTGCSISGLPEHPVEEVSLENIRITFAGGGAADLVGRVVSEAEEVYPEYGMFGALPSYGLYVRHADGIRFSHIRVDYEKPDGRPAFLFDDLRNLTLLDIDGRLDEQAPALVILRGVGGALISGCRPTERIGTFLRADRSRDISIMNNGFSNVGRIFQAGDGMEPDAVFEENNRK